MPYIQIFMDKEISIHAPREGCDARRIHLA